MKILGYIVSKTKVKFDYPYIQHIKDENMIDKSLPCLIIGLQEAKNYCKNDFSILKKQISENVFWTFGRTEKREENERDIKNFCEYVLNNNIKNIKYYYINILNLNYNILKRLYKLCFSNNKRYIYIWNDMIYVLCDNNDVIGISLKIMHYCGIKTDKIISKLKSNKNNIICEKDTCLPYSLQKKFKEKQYIIPYILKLFND